MSYPLVFFIKYSTMSNIEIQYHLFYFGATDTDYARGVAKGGETEDLYKRLPGYGTASHRDNPFRFRFVARVPITDKKMIIRIERRMISKFDRVESDEEDEEDLNRASTVEGIQFKDPKEFQIAFAAVMNELQLDTFHPMYYTTKDEIITLLKEYRSKNIAAAPDKSLSGIRLRPYQDEDIQNTLHSFLQEHVPRGYWSIECGLGKTVMAFELILRIRLPRIFFVVSRTTLLNQALRDFLKWKYPSKQLFHCNGSSLPSDIKNLTRVKQFDQLPTNSPYICVITYDSLVNMKGGNVDLIIFDEGHHLVPSGKKTDLSGNLFGLDDTNIKSRFRLAITGTPKDTPLLYTEDGTIELKGMSHQKELYGICLAERNYIFGRDNGFLSPFEVVCLKTTPTEIRKVINNLRGYLKLPAGTFKEFTKELENWEKGRSRYLLDAIEKKMEEIDEESVIPGDLILWYAIVATMLIESINKYISRRIVTYHTTKRRAELFKQIFSFVWNMQKKAGDFMCETVHSGNNEEINEVSKQKFKAEAGPNVRILCNIRTLVEGFDEPKIDTTLFVDNKWSAIESKQIVGRGNRKNLTNETKIHRVLIPFLAYEIEEAEDIIMTRTSNDYKTVRYTIKNIILSTDPNQSIAQTVWVPKVKVLDNEDESDKEEEDDTEEIDLTERVWIPETIGELHDQDLLGSCHTKDLAEQSFHAARFWMHTIVRKLNWNRFTSESQITQAWNKFRDTHILPNGIPHDPSKVYKQVGWINWRDYTGLLTNREEYSELHAGEFIELLKRGEINVFDHTLSTLRTIVEQKLTRKLPSSPKSKWKKSVYDLAGLVIPGCTKGVNGWGKYADAIYSLLQRERVMDSLDFERLWTALHTKYPDLPGIPTEIFGEAFWANYDY